MFIIVGLGNPGKKYEKTRHNMGFITIDLLAEKLGITVNKLKFKALMGEGFLGTERVLLMKPQTYMNLSGQSVREIVDFYKIPTENLILIYDDIDVERGLIRIRKKGSAGTHNGMRSVVPAVGSEDFPRIRIGIGGDRKLHIRDYVTGGFGKEEKEPLMKAAQRAAEAAICLIEDGIDLAMNRYNGNQ
jgi:PTH1 family peptidyl-tRNA hydrolase